MWQYLRYNNDCKIAKGIPPMTMHLEHPALTTTGKRRGKKKWASASAKQKSQQLAEEWQQRMAKWSKMAPRFSPRSIDPEKTKPNHVDLSELVPRIPPGRESSRIPSLPFTAGACVKSQSNVYTGDKILGIGTLHKSNAVPVFSSEEAVEISKMRR